MLDLGPATEALARIVAGVRDDQLGAPTPCTKSNVADLLDHVDGLSAAFIAAARKSADGKPAPSADGSRLDPHWRTRIPGRLADLAAAWRTDAAWTGMTRAGGIEMPGDIAATVALDEVVVHGWDLAVATGQDFGCDPGLADVAHAFAASVVAQHPNGSEGLFGPPVPVPSDAPQFERLIGLTGRDPAWQPPGS